MIKMKMPHMVCNAQGVPGPDYKMWNSYRVPATHDPDHVLGWCASVAKSAGGKLGSLVINSHGSPAHLYLGTGIGWGEIDTFAQLAGLVDEIYFVACKVVSFTGRNDGNLFCGAIAKAAKTSVYASDHTQDTGLWPTLPYGYIDGYEGKVWKWKPDGSNELTDL